MPGTTSIGIDVAALGIPSPASNVPPGVASSGAQGSQIRYAREDHTHGGVTTASMNAAIAAALATIPTTFVTSTPMTVANLISTYPPSATYSGLYARVTDLYGSVDDIMRCRYDGTNYRWVPQREAFSGTTAATSGSVNIVPLVTPPTLVVTGTLLGNISFTPSTTNAYIGQRQRIYMTGILGLFTATITGLLGSNLTLLGNTYKDIEYRSGGWFGT